MRGGSVVVFAVGLLLSTRAQAQCVDAGSDGFSPQTGCATQIDCDDGAPHINPQRIENCNGLDDDCDGFVDELNCPPSRFGDVQRISRTSFKTHMRV
jgi:hypothetical protein